jgi:carnitine O-acetyltransferase
MDGTPTSRLNDWLLRSIQAKKIDMGSSTPTPDNQLPAPEAVSFQLNEPSKKAIKLAEEHFDAELGPHKISVLQYNGYGKDFIKKCKTSPDSWAQLVMQYAYYKLSGHSRLAGTYESAQTRKFRRGRTEVIRSATPEALDWVKSMQDSQCNNKQRLDYFRKAASAHIKYAGSAADGQGVDRHLYGLKKVMKEGEELPALYTDPAFAASSHWVLSTSQLSSEFFDGWGYGQVTIDNPDYKNGKSSAYDPKTGLNTRPGAFGLAYSVNNTNLRFTITSCDGDTEVMKQYLAEAAEEVRDVITAGMQESEPQVAAKL